MRKVISDTSAIAHLWANEQQDEAKNPSRNFYFEGKTIYSYGSHFPIATIHTNKHGKKVVLFTTRGYSNTTSKHISVVGSACSQYQKIYCYNPRNFDHKANLDAFEKEAKYIAQNQLPNSRKPEIYLSKIAYQHQLATEYAEYFDLLKSPLYKSLSFINVKSKDGSFEASEQERKEQAKAAKRAAIARKKYEAQQAIKRAAEVEKFHNFEVARLYSHANSYLRFNVDTNRIETSQSVEIPAEIAKRAFNWYLNTIKDGGQCTDCNFKILDYEVLQANKQFIQVGCHTIMNEEVNRIAKQLNW